MHKVNRKTDPPIRPSSLQETFSDKFSMCSFQIWMLIFLIIRYLPANYRSSSQSSWRSGGSERISLDRSSDSMQLTPRDLTPHDLAPHDLTPCDRIPRSIMASPSIVASPKHPASNLNPRVRNEGIYSHLDSTMEISDFSGPPSFQSIDLSSENLDRPRASDVSRSSVSSSQASVSSVRYRFCSMLFHSSNLNFFKFFQGKKIVGQKDEVEN